MRIPGRSILLQEDEDEEEEEVKQLSELPPTAGAKSAVPAGQNGVAEEKNYSPPSSSSVAAPASPDMEPGVKAPPMGGASKGAMRKVVIEEDDDEDEEAEGEVVQGKETAVSGAPVQAESAVPPAPAVEEKAVAPPEVKAQGSTGGNGGLRRVPIEDDDEEDEQASGAALPVPSPAVPAMGSKEEAAPTPNVSSEVKAETPTTSAPAVVEEKEVLTPEVEARRLKELGNEALKAGKLEEAIRLYNESLSKDEGNVAVQNNRALAYLKKGNFQEAESDAEAVLKKEPQNVKVRHRLLMRTLGALETRRKVCGCVGHVRTVGD